MFVRRVWCTLVYKLTSRVVEEPDTVLKNDSSTKSVADETLDVSLIVRRAFFQPTSPLGRATRGYVAYDREGCELYFMKDTWRTAYQGHDSEAEVYTKLNDQHIPHLPTILHASDVLSSDGASQCTVISMLALNGCAWNRLIEHDIRPLAHHRIVQKLAVPLISARCSKEYAQAVCDVLDSEL